MISVPLPGRRETVVTQTRTALDFADIEIGITSRQVLGKPLPDLESFKEQVRV